MNTINLYHRADAVVGVGYMIEHCARQQHSIAWPDRVGERMTPEELDRNGVACERMTPIACPCPEEKWTQIEPVNTDIADSVGVVEEVAPKSEAESIRDYLIANPNASNSVVIEAMEATGITVTSSQVSRYRKQFKG